MASYNKVVLLGNVTRLPDVRNLTGSSTTVATTGIAVSKKYKDKEEVLFIDIVVFNKLAEIMGMYVTKGTPLLVEGRLSFRQWEQDGQKRSKHEIIVENFQIIGERREQSNNVISKNEIQEPNDNEMIEDKDIPF